MFNELDRAPLLGPAEQLGEPPLALDQWQLAQVVAVVLQQVEGVQHHLTAPSSVPQRMEVRRPVVVRDHGLAIDQKRCRLEVERGINDGRETVCPVMAALGEAADARAIPPHHQPVAVVLDLVNPERAGRWDGHLRRLARFDEVGWTPTL
jgi:hypothetical protein